MRCCAGAAFHELALFVSKHDSDCAVCDALDGVVAAATHAVDGDDARRAHTARVRNRIQACCSRLLAPTAVEWEEEGLHLTAAPALRRLAERRHTRSVVNVIVHAAAHVFTDHRCEELHVTPARAATVHVITHRITPLPINDADWAICDDQSAIHIHGRTVLKMHCTHARCIMILRMFRHVL